MPGNWQQAHELSIAELGAGAPAGHLLGAHPGLSHGDQEVDRQASLAFHTRQPQPPSPQPQPGDTAEEEKSEQPWLEGEVFMFQSSSEVMSGIYSIS